MKIFTFYGNNNEDKKIYVAAETYGDAVLVVKDINNYAELEYDFNSYKQEHINPMPYLNIEKEYWDTPYILTQKQYDYVKKQINKNNNVLKKEYDHSENDKYNSTILTNNLSLLDGFYKINEKNGRTKENIDIADNIKDNELILKIKKELNNILSEYVYSINNKETRNNIYTDLVNLMNKYEKEFDLNFNKLTKPNKVKFNINDALSMLQNKIKGED